MNQSISLGASRSQWEQQIEIFKGSPSILRKAFIGILKKSDSRECETLIEVLEEGDYPDFSTIFIRTDIGKSLLAVAAEKRKDEIFTQFLARCDLSQRSAEKSTLLHELIRMKRGSYILHVFRDKYQEAARIVDVEDGKNETALFLAAIYSDEVALKTLIKFGADFEKKCHGVSPLEACRSSSKSANILSKASVGDFNVDPRVLVHNQAKIAALKHLGFKRSLEQGNTHQAAQLIERGEVDPNGLIDGVNGVQGNTVTHLAVIHDLPVMERLNQLGADFLRLNHERQNALHLSVIHSSSTALAYLQTRFNSHVFGQGPDNFQKTPLDYLLDFFTEGPDNLQKTSVDDLPVCLFYKLLLGES